ncbi:MAG TPA: hypothetical protein VHX36_05575 [Candidatus Acidoferrales bacterium]|jgi:hypothetical protein|nr:hypothetical protein [Candidatus Acidoferrales bacterium]
MKSARFVAIAIAALFFGAALRADVTVRYKNEMKLGAGAPPMVAQQTAAIMKTAVPTETVIQIKGAKGILSNGNLITLMDFTKQVITVVDPAHKQYATVYMKDYADQVLSVLGNPANPSSGAAKKLLSSMETTLGSEKTGKTDTILGIQAEETLLIFTMYMPTPNGSPMAKAASPNPPTPLVKMILHIWTALPSEVDRVPALNEFSSVYGDASAGSLLNPDAILSKAFGSLPGMDKGFIDLMNQITQKKAVTLRTNIEMYMPFMAQVLQSSAATGQAPSFDPKASVFEVNMEVEQISSAPIDDAVFEVPSDCQLASLPDFFRAYLPATAQAAGGAASPTTAAPSTAPAGGQQ